MAEDVPTNAEDTIVATPAAARLVNAAPELPPPEPEAAPAAEAPAAQAPPEPPAEAPAQAEQPEQPQEPDEPQEPQQEGAAEPEAPPVENNKKWYVVKVQSNREDTIKEAIERRVKKEGLEEFFGQIIIPVEKYIETKPDKSGRKVNRTKERKLYPGYLFCEVEYNDRILYLFRETPGVGDFVGSHPSKLDRAPTPMSDTEVLRMIGPVVGQEEAVPVAKLPPWLQVGERVRVADGAFVGMEGVVKQIHEATNKVQVEVTIFGRPVGVELDHYQVEEV
jgi:transcriptional antiterminator NusG